MYSNPDDQGCLHRHLDNLTKEDNVSNGCCSGNWHLHEFDCKDGKHDHEEFACSDSEDHKKPPEPPLYVQNCTALNCRLKLLKYGRWSRSLHNDGGIETDDGRPIKEYCQAYTCDNDEEAWTVRTLQICILNRRRSTRNNVNSASRFGLAVDALYHAYL